jgi:hypothetical protein
MSYLYEPDDMEAQVYYNEAKQEIAELKERHTRLIAQLNSLIRDIDHDRRHNKRMTTTHLAKHLRDILGPDE